MKGRPPATKRAGEVDAANGRESFRCVSHAGTGPPRDSLPSVHTPTRSVRVARPQRLERLAEENRSGSCAPDPVARKHSLAEPIYHVCRAQPVERLAEEVELEIRSPRGRARVRALTQAKTFELSLADLTLAQMGFQRDPLREPDV